MRLTRQYDAMDCGPACVRMLASAHGKLFPLGWLRGQACLTKEGVSVAGIRRALGEIRYARKINQMYESRCSKMYNQTLSFGLSYTMLGIFCC